MTAGPRRMFNVVVIGLGYIRHFMDVWFARDDEVAEYGMKNYISA